MLIDNPTLACSAKMDGVSETSNQPKRRQKRHKEQFQRLPSTFINVPFVVRRMQSLDSCDQDDYTLQQQSSLLVQEESTCPAES